jgi:hypothetical protein
MSLDHEKRLEIEVGRVLKDLPDLEAPSSLLGQVISRLEERANLPWYRRSWQTWPAPLRVALLMTLLTLFIGLCLAGREFTHSGMAMAAAHRVGEWFSGLGAIANTLAVLLNSLCLVLKKLGTGFVILCLFAVGLAYVMCVGLGTMYMRLTFAKQ